MRERTEHEHDEHAGHAHDEHAEHDHGEHAGHDHDEHAEHDHGAHAEHDHGEHAGHDHGAHAEHDHDEHAGHDHDEHAGHDHDEHAGHDHDAHAGHDHDEHAGHDHDDHSGHDHAGHDHSHDYRDASRRSLIIALVLITGFMVAEVIGGILSGSLALLADAGHMITDSAAIALALLALWVSGRPSSTERTYGFRRTEVLAAFLNALSLWVIAGWIFFEAYRRLRDVPEIEGGIMLIVGGIGLVVNIVAAWVLHSSAQHSMNVEGAFKHVLADLMGSIGVVISGVVVITLGWTIVDPILSILIGLLILAGSWRLTVKVFNVLLEGVPEHIDVYRLCSEIEEQEGVTLIHDVHVWTISSGYEAMSAHVLVDPSYRGNRDELLRRMCAIARSKYSIGHVTLQLEDSVSECTEDHHVGHLEALTKIRRRKLVPF